MTSLLHQHPQHGAVWLRLAAAKAGRIHCPKSVRYSLLESPFPLEIRSHIIGLNTSYTVPWVHASLPPTAVLTVVTSVQTQHRQSTLRRL